MGVLVLGRRAPFDNNSPYTQATDLLRTRPLSDHRGVRLGNATTCGPLVAHRWPAGGLPMAVTSDPPAGHERLACKYVGVFFHNRWSQAVLRQKSTTFWTYYFIQDVNVYISNLASEVALLLHWGAVSRHYREKVYTVWRVRHHRKKKKLSLSFPL